MNKLTLPASCTRMTAAEAQNTLGGSALETAGKAVVAVGAAGALLIVAGTAARSILNFFHPNGVEGAISDSIHAGSSFIQNSVEAGRSFLDRLMGK